jgi:hypothetical protein
MGRTLRSIASQWRDGRPGTKEKRRDHVSGLNQTSAKIYQFPVGGRGTSARRDRIGAETASNPANILTCSSWYHEIAMLDDQSAKQQ